MSAYSYYINSFFFLSLEFNWYLDYVCNSTDEIKCEETGYCIDKEYICDGQLDCCGEKIEGSGEEDAPDCSDTSDERNCSQLAQLISLYCKIDSNFIFL